VAAGGAAAVTVGAVCDAGGAVVVAFAVPPLVGGRTVGVDTAVLLAGAMAGGALLIDPPAGRLDVSRGGV